MHRSACRIYLHTFSTFGDPEWKWSRCVFCSSDHHGAFHCCAQLRSTAESFRWSADNADGSYNCARVDRACFLFSPAGKCSTSETRSSCWYAGWLAAARHNAERLWGWRQWNRLDRSAVERHTSRDLHFDDHRHNNRKRRHTLADRNVDRELTRGGRPEPEIEAPQ